MAGGPFYTRTKREESRVFLREKGSGLESDGVSRDSLPASSCSRDPAGLFPAHTSLKCQDTLSVNWGP